jgi:hypothetical protein
MAFEYVLALRDRFEAAAREALVVRARFSGQSLAHPYGDPMPPRLVKARQALSCAVHTTYVPDGGNRDRSSDVERVAFLFDRYLAMAALCIERLRRINEFRCDVATHSIWA